MTQQTIITTPHNSGLGDPAFTAFEKANANFTELYTPINRTAAEIAAGVTPTSIGYLPGNVLRYGADPTGVADSTTPIRNAILGAASGGTIYFPAGTYLISGLLTVLPNQTWSGAGRFSSTLKTSSASAGIFSAPSNVNNYVIQDLGFNGQGTQTSGQLAFVNALYGIIQRCYFTGYNIAVNNQDNAGVMRDCVFANANVNTGVGISVTGAAGGLVLESILMIPPASRALQGLAGIQVFSCGAIQITDCNIIQQGTCLYVTPGTGQVVATIYGYNTFFDSAVAGITLVPSGTGSIVRCHFNACWSTSHTTSGIIVNAGGGTIDGIDFIDHHCFGNTSNGLNYVAGINVNISGGAYCGSTAGSGISIAANVSKFSIIGATCGAGYGFAGNAFGIFMGGTNGSFIINENNLQGNTNTNLALGTVSGSAISIQNNLGYNPVGVSAITVTASPFTHTNGPTSETVYIAGGTVSAVTLNGVAVPAGLQTFRLNPLQSIVVTYSVVPTMTKSVD